MRAAKGIAIVTGGGSGIGRAAALGLATAGYSVIVAGRGMQALEATVTEGNKSGGRVTAVPVDIRDPESVHALFTSARGTFGRLDLLFNNAGIASPAVPLEAVTFEQWQAIVNTNLTGTFLCTQEAIRLMKTQDPIGGRIINNGSLSAHSPRPNSAPYTATKHGITGLTKSTSLDGRAYGIACGQIDIGNASSQMTVKMSEGVLQADGSLRAEPTIDPRDVATAILYMAALPLDSNVQFLTLMATNMPFIGRG